MKLSRYIEALISIQEEYKHLTDFELVTSSDDEGNDFNSVHYTPAVGVFNGEDWISSEELGSGEPTHVLLN